jgi:hypothetical protein
LQEERLALEPLRVEDGDAIDGSILGGFKYWGWCLHLEHTFDYTVDSS